MAKISKTYKSGDEFTPGSVNEIIAAVNENTDDIVATKTYVDDIVATKTYVDEAIGAAIKKNY